MENLAGYAMEVSVGEASMLRGEAGKSAYEIAVQNGYSGTETEWLASLSGSGLSSSERSTLIAVVNSIGAFNVTNGQELIDSFNDAWVQKIPATGITLSAASLSFIDGTSQTLRATVEPSDSTDTVVWSSSNPAVATVSNGVVTPVANGDCVITATAGSVSASCAVNVAFAAEVVYYTITNNLTNVTNSNAATSVEAGGYYSATLSAETGYNISVNITMGGVDITDTAYADGVITIATVTGDVVITALATATVNPGWTKDVPYNITWEDGTWYEGNNGAKEEAGMSNSGYLPCDGLRYLDVTGAYLNRGINCYDAEKNLLGQSASNRNESSLLVPLMRDTKYVIVNKRSSSAGQVTPRELPFLGEQTVPVAGQKYALDIKWHKTVWNTTGEEKDDTNEYQYCSSFCFCYGFAALTFDTKFRSIVKFYDANKQYLSDAIMGASSATVNIPEGATYFRYDNGSYTKTYPYVILEEATS